MKYKRYYELLADYLSGEITAEDCALLEKIWNEKPDLKKEYDIIQELELYTLDPSNESRNASLEKLILKLNNTRSIIDFSYNDKKGTKILLYRTLAAASIIGVLFLGIYFVLNLKKENKIDFQNYASIHNSIYQNTKKIVLPDSSIVVLGRNSKLSWHPTEFNNSTRDVYLEGEGFFDVKKNQRIPFLVHTKHELIKVLGTTFNVKAYENASFQTALIRGKIELHIKDYKEVFILHPDDKIIVDAPITNNPQKIVRERLKKYSIKNADLLQDTAWLQKTFIWDNTPLKEIVLDMENFYNVKVNIKNKELEDYRFSGSSNNESLEIVLKTLSSVRGFNYSIDQNKNVNIQK